MTFAEIIGIAGPFAGAALGALASYIAIRVELAELKVRVEGLARDGEYTLDRLDSIFRLRTLPGHLDSGTPTRARNR